MSNPHIDIDEVIKLWAKSTGNDPENPPLDIERPTPIEIWGRYPDYDVTLDSGQRGAVFSGKPIVFKVERRGDYRDEAVSLELAMDGKFIANLTASYGKEVRQVLVPEWVYIARYDLDP